jgi:hypothetical protein
VTPSGAFVTTYVQTNPHDTGEVEEHVRVSGGYVPVVRGVRHRAYARPSDIADRERRRDLLTRTIATQRKRLFQGTSVALLPTLGLGVYHPAFLLAAAGVASLWWAADAGLEKRRHETLAERNPSKLAPPWIAGYLPESWSSGREVVLHGVARALDGQPPILIDDTWDMKGTRRTTVVSAFAVITSQGAWVVRCRSAPTLAFPKEAWHPSPEASPHDPAWTATLYDADPVEVRGMKGKALAGRRVTLASRVVLDLPPDVVAAGVRFRGYLGDGRGDAPLVLSRPREPVEMPYR